MTKPRRVLVIGYDGATWDLAAPWMEEGLLPNLAKLAQTGTKGKLRSTVHPVTTPAWTSFLTGQQQGKHGIYDHVHRKQGSYGIALTNASMIQSPLIFDHLGEHSLKSISLNVPYTFPPRSIPGVMVSGLFATSVGPEITSPPELYQEIAGVAPNYVVHPDFDPRADDPLIHYLDAYLTAIEDRFKAAEYLLEQKEWHYAITVFTATDQIQHSFWHAMKSPSTDDVRAERVRNAILEVYKTLDAGLPRILQYADEHTLTMVMSDHGAGELHRWVHLNRWLAERGHLVYRSNKRGFRPRLLNEAASRYKRHLPAKLRASIRKRFAGGFDRAKSELESQLFASPINWAETRAYSLGACGNIFLNVRNREPEGTVNPGADYAALREQIKDELEQLRDPETEQLLVKQVHRREELYSGPFVELAPDLLIEWHDYRYWGRGRYDQSIPTVFEPPSTWDFSDLPLTGTHRPDGILVAAGPGIPQGQTLEGANLIDLTPTALAFLGVPIPRSMDGKVLTRLFEPGSLSPVYADSQADSDSGDAFDFSDEDRDKIMNRLEDLGYL